MKLEFSTNFIGIIYPGTYGTLLGDYLFDIRDEHVDDWFNAIKEHCIDKINEILMEETIVKEFGEMHCNNSVFVSPQFYNFENDSVNFDLVVPEITVKKIRESEYDESFYKWTKEKYGSHDGFISFFPYCKDSFERALTKDDVDFSRAFSMVLMKFIEENFTDPDFMEWQKDFEDSVINELCNNDWVSYEDENDKY